MMDQISFQPDPIIVVHFSEPKFLHNENNTLEHKGLLNIDKDAFSSILKMVTDGVDD
jgi:hypothetical protein